MRGSDYIQVKLDTVCPISAHESGIFQILAGKFNLGAPVTS